MKKKLFQGLIILGAVLALIIVTFAVVEFNNDLNFELEQLLEEKLSDTALQQQTALNQELENGRAMLQHIAKSLPFLTNDEEVILEFLDTLDSDFNFENLLLIEMTGRGMLSNGDKTDISDMDYFHSASNGELVTTAPFTSIHSGNQVMVIAAPIYYEGVVAGVIAAEYSLDYLTKSLSIASDGGHSYAMVVDNTGAVLFCTNPDYDSFENLTEAEYVDRPVEDVANDLANSHSGRVRFTIDSIEKIAEYIPLNINGWSLVFVATAEEISSGASNITNNMMMLSASIFCFVTLIALYVMRSRRDALRRIEQLAYYDELTGAPNLVKFKLDAQELLSKHHDKQFIMIKMDIMNFKGINEIFGFELGDKVLKTIANNGSTVPEPTFTQGRVGTDEFMMFSAGGLFEDMPTTTAYYEKQFKRLLPELQKHQFSFRYGRYIVEPGNTDINDIVNKTIIAHSFAKMGGGNNLWDYDDKFKQRVLRMTEISNKMEEALLNGHFKVFLQPKYRITDSKIVGAEALVRWIEPDNSMVFPDEFIPLFESNGFIIRLDMNMLENVCLLLKSWQKSGRKCVPISVNFSRVHLRNPHFVEEIKATVNRHGISCGLVEVELTETTVTENEAELKNLLDSLHSAGFLVAIDDFGAGYSSLGMLKNFHVDTLKLDKSFFNNENSDFNDERGDIVIGGITKLAKNLYMKTVAEGIEDAQQVELLKKVNCDIAQGYYYAKPMAVTDFETLLFSTCDHTGEDIE